MGQKDRGGIVIEFDWEAGWRCVRLGIMIAAVFDGKICAWDDKRGWGLHNFVLGMLLAEVLSRRSAAMDSS
jgi:hypothetical protein